VVVAAGACLVTFEALRWCSSLGVGVVVVGAMSTLASTPRVTTAPSCAGSRLSPPMEPVGLGVPAPCSAPRWLAKLTLCLGRFGDSKAERILPGTRESFEERSSTITELAEASKGSTRTAGCSATSSSLTTPSKR